MILRILKSIEFIKRFEKDGVVVGSDRRVKSNCKYKLDGNEVNSSKVGNNEIKKNDQKISKSKKLFKCKKTIGSLDFLPLKLN